MYQNQTTDKNAVMALRMQNSILRHSESPVNLKLPEFLYGMLKEEAEKTNRSINQTARDILNVGIIALNPKAVEEYLKSHNLTD